MSDDADARAAFEWHEVNSIDEMEEFFRSRLPAIAEAARLCGYAIGVHGSLRRDLDLIAAPWVEEHTDAGTLARAIHRAACGLEQESYQWDDKPLGRIAVSMAICWTSDSMGYDTPNLGHIDLSVMPSRSIPAAAALLREAGWKVEEPKVCEECHGDRLVRDYAFWLVPCPTCNGTGARKVGE